jgi:hypothetical protein
VNRTPWQATDSILSEQATSKVKGKRVDTWQKLKGKILGVGPEWLHTDSGDIRIEYIVHAKWVGEEEASIIRGGPLGGNGYSLSGREPGRFPIR